MDGQSNCTTVSPASWELSAASESAEQKWYKPILSVHSDAFGNKHVYKAFRFSRGLLGRYFLFLASHEFNMLKRVEHLDFTPDQISRGSDNLPTIKYRLIEGTPIKGIAGKNRIPEGFFSALFNDVRVLHQNGVVHMDLGNSGNILVSQEGRPVIIDFGSAVPLNRLPSGVRSWALKKDLLGVLKLWQRFDSESLPPTLLRYFHRNYRKNIYTPKRFFKAVRKQLNKDEARLDGSGLTTVISLFIGLLVLVSLA